jgi:hypothetical protein
MRGGANIMHVQSFEQKKIEKKQNHHWMTGDKSH